MQGDLRSGSEGGKSLGPRSAVALIDQGGGCVP